MRFIEEWAINRFYRDDRWRQWHTWFAWWPAYLDVEGRTVWWQPVERLLAEDYEENRWWKYRLPTLEQPIDRPH